MEIDSAVLSEALGEALRGGEYADAFCERRIVRSFRLQEGRIHEAGRSVAIGVGVRVISGESVGHAYTDDLTRDGLRGAARVAALVARHGARPAQSVALAQAAPVPALYSVDESAEERAAGEFVDLLARADRAARAYDPRVRDVNATISQELQHVVIATSDGRIARDVRPLVTLAVQTVARGAVRATGYAGDGGRGGLDLFATLTPESIADEASRIAIVGCDAVEAPSGEMPVVVGSGGGGVLLHEAVGHGLEGDFNRQGTSLYSGRIGERVASELVTIYDDGNLPGERGSIAIDDEGTAGSHKVLIENGVLRGYMLDRLNGTLMGAPSTGSGRRQSFRVLPQPRMCNTYMPDGTSSPDEIIASVERGVYARSFSGGQVEISKGDFVFMVAEGYLIEGGKVTRPIRGATLVGNGPEAMRRVTAVGADSRLASGHYTCGKGGQLVPVGVGMPTVKIELMTVGGSALDA